MNLKNLRYSDEEDAKSSVMKKLLASIPVRRNYTRNAVCSNLRRLHFIELYEEEYLDDLIRKLANFGFDLNRLSQLLMEFL